MFATVSWRPTVVRSLAAPTFGSMFCGVSADGEVCAPGNPGRENGLIQLVYKNALQDYSVANLLTAHLQRASEIHKMEAERK